VLEEECRRLNEGFCRHMATRLPFVTLKLAASLDGKTATHTGQSQWITGPQARAEVHRQRELSDAILVGSATVLRDDPQLTVRLEKKSRRKPPLRVVLDSRLQTPRSARVLDGAAPTLLITTPLAPESRIVELRGQGVDVAVVAERNGHVDLESALRLLSQRGCLYVLAEPGARLGAALVEAGLVQRFWFFFAPRLIGGQNAPGILGGSGVALLAETPRLRLERVRQLGPDLLVEAVPEPLGDAEPGA
jgi:diaminohydroxyphosphoribosylaminopyrimidine deaminase/5-amino-6-(5-phosphoribosylamino)uracil reductase